MAIDKITAKYDDNVLTFDHGTREAHIEETFVRRFPELRNATLLLNTAENTYTFQVTGGTKGI